MKSLLVTLHSRFSHASLALPSLAAACTDAAGVECVIREWTVHEYHDRLLRLLVAEEADLYGFSCYIWNVEQTLRLVDDLKRIRPNAVVILGGPEVSYGTFDLMASQKGVDCIVRGEGEVAFREVAELVHLCCGPPPPELLSSVAGITYRDGDETLATPDRPPLACLDELPSPCSAGLVDIRKPLVYLETSRGCPFSCAFCLSSRDRSVRSYSSQRIRDDLAYLMANRVQTIKLVDRTFNYDAARASDIWEFILATPHTSRFHFEIAADLLTDGNFSVLRRVPSDMFRFEIGVQSGDPDTLRRVGRSSDLPRLVENIRRLLHETRVTIHLDLVAGLPGEGYEGFLSSLNNLLELHPHHLQVEPLKVLKGTPMRRIAVDEGYTYSAAPPYKILRTPWLSFAEINRIEHVARLLDLVVNSGRFPAFLAAMARQMPVAEFLDRMAGCEDDGPPESSSLISLCNLLDRFLRDRYPGAHGLRDALVFDYCRAEYPVIGRLPTCFGDNPGSRASRGPEDRSIPGGGTIPSQARIRRFRRWFLSNYLESGMGDGETEYLFTYVAMRGEGEKVLVSRVEY